MIALLALAALGGCGVLGKKLTPLEKASGHDYLSVLTYAGSQGEHAYARLEGRYPVFSDDGAWERTDLAPWAEGYYPAMLWLLYQSTQDPAQLQLAQRWVDGLEQFKDDSTISGLGQLFQHSHVLGYQITGNHHYRDVALEAARTMSSRFNPAGFFPVFGVPGDTLLARRLSIETMMDLELLFWATEATGNREFAAQAFHHAIFTMRRMINGDGKILHMADFDPRTGQPSGDRIPELADDKRHAPKGYSASSVWALGQAWAIYGFTTAYRHASHTQFLSAAKLAADYYLENMPANGIPPWDFELPEGADRRQDTGAAAVAAAALLRLAQVMPDGADRQRYRQAGFNIVQSLLTSEYYGSARYPGVLGGGVYCMQLGKGIGGSTSWGDYHFIEALLLLRDFKS